MKRTEGYFWRRPTRSAKHTFPPLTGSPTLLAASAPNDREYDPRAHARRAEAA